ncbi:MAG: serine hydrolase [Rhodospirillaceae bacterium]
MQSLLSRVLTAAAVCLAVHGTARAQSAAPAASGLTRLLEAELARFSGTGGIYIHSLGTGEEAAVRGDQKFDSASTIKMAVMVLAYQLQDQKKLNLNDRYVIKPSDYRGGSGIFKYKDPGLNPTLRDVITQMVITSDNSATDIMIAKVGGVAAVNAFLKQAGFATLHLNMTTNDYFRRPFDLADPKNKSLTPEDVFATGTNLASFTEPRKDLIARLRKEVADKNINEEMKKRAFDETTWLGIVTPNEMGRLVEGIEKGTIASKAACEEMKRIMRAQQSGSRKIPHYLSVPVAHKTGETNGVTNDVGMIYARSGPIIIAFYTIGYTGLAADADDRLGHVARLIVEYFDGPPTPRGGG